jgi:hypothetical protein
VTTVQGAVYTLDPRLSSYTISVIEDRTPGVRYYRGDFSGKLIYNTEGGGAVTVNQWGSFYGYDSAWSNTETHRMNVTVEDSGGWAMQYEIRPSVSVNKILQYTENEPTPISFEGNYKEVLQQFAGLRYDIYVMPPFMALANEPASGALSIESVNTFEQLPEPDLTFMKGNAAEDNIRRLFAMRILSGDPKSYLPSQSITRGQFMTALAKAIKLPVDALPAAATRRRQPLIINLFSDVDTTRPEYQYVEAIYKAGIAYGRDNGSFDFDKPLQRQEAFASIVRALGLTQLGLNPTAATIFTDDGRVADWAKRELSVAHMLGLIYPDQYGRILPDNFISKGEAAELLNILIEYMRTGLAVDYADQIVNIAGD